MIEKLLKVIDNMDKVNVVWDFLLKLALTIGFIKKYRILQRLFSKEFLFILVASAFFIVPIVTLYKLFKQVEAFNTIDWIYLVLSVWGVLSSFGLIFIIIKMNAITKDLPSFNSKPKK